MIDQSSVKTGGYLVKLHNLRDFVTVARCGGIRAAARALNLTQPALSKSIQQLEQELGTPLFERTSHGSALNSYGEAFLIRAEAAMQELSRGRHELQQLLGSASGSVVIAVSSVASLMFLTSALKRFRQRFSAAEVRVLEGTYAVMVRGLRDRSLDFAIGPKPAAPLPEDFVLEELFANERCVVGRKGHPLARSRSLKMLTNAEWVVTGAVGPQDEEFREIFLRHNLPVPNCATRCESLIALLAFLAGSDTLAFLPRQWVESPLTENLLAEIKVTETIPGPPTCLLRRSGMPLTPAAEALANAFRREITYYERQQKA